VGESPGQPRLVSHGRLSGTFGNIRMTWRDPRDLGAIKAFPCMSGESAREMCVRLDV